MIKTPASLLLAAVLAASALSTSAQQGAAPAAPGGAAPAAALPAVPPGPSAATPSITAPAAIAPDAPARPDVNLGQARYGALCAACHGADGNSGTPVNPKLAGQHPAYLVKQLAEFKNGQRPSPIMQGFAAQLSDADMQNVAAFLGVQPAKSGFAKDRELVSLGERIYRGGIMDRKLPACSGCHSPNGAGIPAVYPRLSGQHADYTASQLVAFRDGIRKNSPQMSAIASRMNDREIRAVADYIAGLR